MAGRVDRTCFMGAALGRRGARSWQPSGRLTLITCLVPPRAETLDGTSPVQQTRKSQQRSASYARKKRNLLNSGVSVLTWETINGFGHSFDRLVAATAR